jgi:hypothetical protein
MMIDERCLILANSLFILIVFLPVLDDLSVIAMLCSSLSLNYIAIYLNNTSQKDAQFDHNILMH